MGILNWLWGKRIENLDFFLRWFQNPDIIDYQRNSKNRQQFAMNSFIAYQGRTNVTSRGNFSQRKKLEVECISPGEKKRPLGLFLVYVSWTTLGELNPGPSYAYRFFKWESLLCAKLLQHSFRPKTTSSFLHNLLTPGQENGECFIIILQTDLLTTQA